MRRVLACLGMLLCGGLLLATGVGNDRLAEGPAGPKLSDEQVTLYTDQLLQTMHEVRWRYVRSVSAVDLLGAALGGLYEAAHVPVPDGLRGELEAAEARAAKNPGVVENDVEGGAKLNEWARMHPAFSEVVARVRRHLGDRESLRGAAALHASLRAMTKCLDAHSRIVSGTELLRGSGRELNFGVGLELRDNPGGPLLIKTVVPGSPAQRAGLRPGDILTHIHVATADKPLPTNPMALDSAVRLLNQPTTPDVMQVSALGTTGDSVELFLEREESGRKRAWKQPLKQQSYHAETVLGARRQEDGNWDYLLDHANGVGYIRIAEFGPSTAEDLHTALNHVRGAGPRGLVLDLRWCPGGMLKAAVDVAGLFVKEGKLAVVRMRNEPETVYSSTAGFKLLDLPVVVLVNAETSGGAELVAAALQDHGRARVVGQRTVGKGSVQTIIPVPGVSYGFKVTSGTFIRPNGKGLHRFPDSKPTDEWGVQPDADWEVRVSPELSRQLRELWLQQTLRPAESNEVLPLDDPDSDPLLQQAIRALATTKSS